jgi:hypothetical protein
MHAGGDPGCPLGRRGNGTSLPTAVADAGMKGGDAATKEGIRPAGTSSRPLRPADDTSTHLRYKPGGQPRRHIFRHKRRAAAARARPRGHCPGEARPAAHPQARPHRQEPGNPNNHQAGRRLGRHARNPPRDRRRRSVRPRERRPSPISAGQGRRRVWNGRLPLSSDFVRSGRSQARHGL